ncbi:PPC domain-containing DNA-binding protein [Fructilactobacillus florum]|uniref:PPC domain-containing DNA-binding protein n=1 Tax=Fructilactobacillus florum TaxID=640331 RepID=UPI00055100CD|nr:DUF296 domain-containing protein [Fructilactobacillus florum]
MQYKQLGQTIYLRVDKGEEILTQILKVCADADIKSATFSGIGACQAAVLSTYLPNRNDFTDHHLSGMLELVSLSGNVTFDGEALYQHAHATFSELGRDGEPHVVAGHLTSATVMYTGEITIQPMAGVIPRKFDDNVGITVWDLD